MKNIYIVHPFRQHNFEQAAELKKHFPAKMFDTIVPRNIRLAEAPSHGKPISEYDKYSKGSQSYKKLAREIEKRLYI